jgi:hypothetical protein
MNLGHVMSIRLKPCRAVTQGSNTARRVLRCIDTVGPESSGPPIQSRVVWEPRPTKLDLVASDSHSFSFRIRPTYDRTNPATLQRTRLRYPTQSGRASVKVCPVLKRCPVAARLY